MNLRSLILATVTLLIPATVGCTSNWSKYPWADRGEICEMEVIGHGVYRSLPPFPSAKGMVLSVTGEALPEGLDYRIAFSSHDGSQVITTRSPTFGLCIENPRRMENYVWFAEVRRADGVMAFRSPAPQPFIATEPIVVLVEPVSE